MQKSLTNQKHGTNKHVEWMTCDRRMDENLENLSKCSAGGCNIIRAGDRYVNTGAVISSENSIVKNVVALRVLDGRAEGRHKEPTENPWNPWNPIGSRQFARNLGFQKRFGALLLSFVFIVAFVPSFTTFYRVLLFFYWVLIGLLGFTGFYWVLPGFQHFYRVLLFFFRFFKLFYRVFNRFNWL